MLASPVPSLDFPSKTVGLSNLGNLGLGKLGKVGKLVWVAVALAFLAGTPWLPKASQRRVPLRSRPRTQQLFMHVRVRIPIKLPWRHRVISTS